MRYWIFFFLPFLCFADSSADSSDETLSSWRSTAYSISSAYDSALSKVQTASHNLTVARSVSESSGGYDDMIRRLLRLRSSLARISAFSHSVSGRLSRATYPLDEYGYDVETLSSVATQSIDKDLEDILTYIALSVDNVGANTKNTSTKLDAIGEQFVICNTSLGAVHEILEIFRPMMSPSRGVMVFLDADTMRQIDTNFDNLSQQISNLAGAINKAVKDGTSDALDDFGSGLGPMVQSQVDYLYKLENVTHDISNLLGDWYAWQVNTSSNFISTASILREFYESWNKTRGMNIDEIDDYEALDIPIVRVLGDFNSSNNFEYTEKFYKENFDGLDTAAKKLFASDGGFNRDFSNIYWPSYRMSFPFAGFRDYDDSTTNTPSVTIGEIYSYDGLTQLAEILWQTLRVSGNSSVIQAEILKALRPSGEDVAEDEYTTSLSGLEDEYSSEDGWSNHFTNTVGLVESFKDKFSGKVDSSAIDTISSGFISSDLPSVLIFKVPSYSIGNYTVETQYVNSPALNEYRWFFDGVRNLFIFLWWSAAVSFVYALARVILFYLTKFIADPVSAVVQGD